MSMLGNHSSQTWFSLKCQCFKGLVLAVVLYKCMIIMEILIYTQIHMFCKYLLQYTICNPFQCYTMYVHVCMCISTYICVYAYIYICTWYVWTYMRHVHIFYIYTQDVYMYSTFVRYLKCVILSVLKHKYIHIYMYSQTHVRMYVPIYACGSANVKLSRDKHIKAMLKPGHV